MEGKLKSTRSWKQENGDPLAKTGLRLSRWGVSMLPGGEKKYRGEEGLIGGAHLGGNDWSEENFTRWKEKKKTSCVNGIWEPRGTGRSMDWNPMGIGAVEMW